VEGDLVGDAGPVRVGWRASSLFRQFLNLQARAVDQQYADVQASQEVNVGENVYEVVVGDDGPVQGDHKVRVPKPRYIPQDLAQVGQLVHFIRYPESVVCRVECNIH